MKFLSILILVAWCVAMSSACAPALGKSVLCPFFCKLNVDSNICKAACGVWPNMLNCPVATTTTTTAAPAAAA